jgi:phenylacetate-coenzyme A ligase PaaK-like adenylate-forming protein
MSAGLTELRAAHMARAHELAPEFIARLGWDAATMATHRRTALRSLVATAVERSPWHRKRLHAVDPDALDPEDLRALPVMTKADLMAGFDDIVTDERLRLAEIEAHLAAGDGGYLFDEYTAMATGGSSGVRGLSVFDRDGLAAWWLSSFRRILRDRDVDPQLRGRSVTTAWVAAAHPSHVSATLARTFDDPGFVNVRFPVTLPLAEIVAGLNQTDPHVLFAYPSALALLVAEAQAGRLRITPVQVWCASEPLLPEIRRAAEATFGRAVHNCWGATEIGGLATACRLGTMHLAQDLGIVEPVDELGRPVPAGERSARILVTNLFNRVLPLIRYEISDELTVLPDPCPCGESTPCLGDVQGRADDVFRYPGVVVHPLVFRSTLGRHPAIVEYQVRQTADGATVDVCLSGPLDLVELAADLTRQLHGLGLADPRVRVRPVDRVARLPHTGKVQRFVPLAVTQ